MEINKKKEKIEINILLPEKEVSKKLKKDTYGVGLSNSFPSIRKGRKKGPI